MRGPPVLLLLSLSAIVSGIVNAAAVTVGRQNSPKIIAPHVYDPNAVSDEIVEKLATETLSLPTGEAHARFRDAHATQDSSLAAILRNAERTLNKASSGHEVVDGAVLRAQQMLKSPKTELPEQQVPEARDFLSVEADTEQAQTFAFAEGEPARVHADLRPHERVSLGTELETQQLLRSVVGEPRTRFSRYKNANADGRADGELEIDAEGAPQFRSERQAPPAVGADAAALDDVLLDKNSLSRMKELLSQADREHPTPVQNDPTIGVLHLRENE